MRSEGSKGGKKDGSLRKSKFVPTAASIAYEEVSTWLYRLGLELVVSRMLIQVDGLPNEARGMSESDSKSRSNPGCTCTPSCPRLRPRGR
jgi:hypothetical protein